MNAIADKKPYEMASDARQSGVSLIELMVSVAIGLLVVAVLINLYVNTSRTNREMANANSQIENGRFSMQLLQNDIVHAGFWGSYVPQYDDLTATGTPGDVPGLVPEIYAAYNATNWTAGYKNSLIGISVQAYDAAPGCTDPGGGCTTERVVNRQANTDVLVVRHAETCIPGVGNCAAYSANDLYFQASECGTDTSPYVLDTSGLTLRKRDCAATANLRKFTSHIYYVRDYAVTAGDGIPTLMRSDFDYGSSALAYQPAQPLIEGIEGFRVELGVDTISDNGTDITTGTPPLYTQAITWADPTNLISPTNRGDGVPDSFIRCTTASPCSLAQLTNVVAVKVYVLARARTTSPGYVDTKTYCMGSLASDGSCPTTAQVSPCSGLSGAALTTCQSYKRHVFSATMRLNNVSGRRDTPK